MRYLGLLENVRVRRAGFAHRETYKRFESRYKMVSAATWPRGTGDARASTQTILAELQISGKPGSVQMGKTKVAAPSFRHRSASSTRFVVQTQ